MTIRNQAAADAYNAALAGEPSKETHMARVTDRAFGAMLKAFEDAGFAAPPSDDCFNLEVEIFQFLSKANRE
jgi:hypothetical protein